MPNDLFLASNEPAQQAMRNIGIQQSQNALTQQTQLENQNMQMNLQRRQELEQLLRTSQNPERDGYEWAKRNDQKLYTDLSKFYMDRFLGKIDMDENGARNELENATGEQIQMGERYVALFKNESGQIDPSLGVVDKITKQLYKPHDAKGIAEVRADTMREVAGIRATMGEEVAKIRAENAGDPIYRQWRIENPAAPISEFLKLKAKYSPSSESPFQKPQSQFAGMDKQGNQMAYIPERGGAGNLVPIPGSTGPLQPKTQSFEERRARSNARSGLRAISDVRNMLKDKNILIQAAVPGSIGARKFEAARREMIDVITRLRTGAALNTDEEKFYHGQAPTVLDLTDPEAIEYKLRQFENLFNDLATGGVDAQGVGTAGGTMGGAAQTKEINGVMYEKVEGGWRKVKR